MQLEFARSTAELPTEALHILYSCLQYLYSMSLIYRYRREGPPVRRCSSEVLHVLIDLLPSVLEMRKSGSENCERQSETLMRHICVVDSNPRSQSFGVLFEFVSRRRH